MGVRKGLTVFYEMMKLYCFISVASILFFSCQSRPVEKKQQSYYVVENDSFDSCSIYKMIFYKGDYIFRFALSGKCPSLTSTNYIADYEYFLNKYKENMRLKGKFIRLEYYPSIEIDKKSIDAIVEITGNATKRNVVIFDSWNEGVVLELR